jgi:hypothetical protein
MQTLLLVWLGLTLLVVMAGALMWSHGWHKTIVPQGRWTAPRRKAQVVSIRAFNCTKPLDKQAR